MMRRMMSPKMTSPNNLTYKLMNTFGDLSFVYRHSNMSGDDSEAFQRFFKTAAEGGWRLLQHYMCGPTRGFRASQRGNGLGGIHCARNSHRVIPLNAFDGVVQSGQGPGPKRYEKENGPRPRRNEEKECNSRPVVIKMISASEQTAEQARSNLKREAEERKKEARPKKRRKVSPV